MINVPQCPKFVFCNETTLIKLTAPDIFKVTVHISVTVRARLLVVNTCKRVNITDNAAET